MKNQTQISLLLIILFLFITIFAGVKIHYKILEMNTTIVFQRTMLKAIQLNLTQVGKAVVKKKGEVV